LTTEKYKHFFRKICIDIKASKFRILNTAENTAHKNVLISVLDNENFDFKM
jgi:hypothetical protein